MPELDMGELRATLARERVTRRKLADACGIDYAHLIEVLNGGRRLAPQTARKLMTGLATLRLDGQAQHG